MATITDPLERMRYLIARSANWRAWCGITGTEEEKTAAAYARTYRRFTFDPDNHDLPLIVVSGMPNAGARRTASGGGCFIRTFEIRVLFTDGFTGSPDDELTERAEFDAFEDNVSAVLNDIDALSGSASYVKYDERRHTEDFSRTLPEVVPARLFTEFTFTGELIGSQSE